MIKKFSELCLKAKSKVLYGFFSVLIGICFILAQFVTFSIMSLFIGAFIAVIGIIQIVSVIKGRKDPPEDDSVLGITLLSIALITVMPGINDTLFALMPIMILLLGLGILIEGIFRVILKNKGKGKPISFWLKLPVSLLLIAIGLLFFLVESIITYIMIVVGIIFIAFGLYGGIRSFSIQPEPEFEKIPDYE